MIEKHLCIDDEIETVDSFFSMSQKRFSHFVHQIRRAELACGSISYEVSKSALPNVRSKRSIYISEDIAQGSTFSSCNIKCVRPAHGLDPRYYYEIIGKTAARDLKAGDRLTIKDIIESVTS